MAAQVRARRDVIARTTYVRTRTLWLIGVQVHAAQLGRLNTFVYGQPVQTLLHSATVSSRHKIQMGMLMAAVSRTRVMTAIASLVTSRKIRTHRFAEKQAHGVSQRSNVKVRMSRTTKTI